MGQIRRKELNEAETKYVFIALNKLYYKALKLSFDHKDVASNDFDKMRTEIGKLQEYINLYDC